MVGMWECNLKVMKIWIIYKSAQPIMPLQTSAVLKRLVVYRCVTMVDLLCMYCWTWHYILGIGSASVFRWLVVIIIVVMFLFEDQWWQLESNLARMPTTRPWRLPRNGGGGGGGCRCCCCYFTYVAHPVACYHIIQGVEPTAGVSGIKCTSDNGQFQT